MSKCEIKDGTALGSHGGNDLLGRGDTKALPSLLDALVQIVLVLVELARPRRSRSVSAGLAITQIPPRCVARAAELLGDGSDSFAPSCHHSYLHCFLLGQHRRHRKARHPRPGGSLLLRRSGSVLLRRQHSAISTSAPLPCIVA